LRGPVAEARNIASRVFAATPPSVPEAGEGRIWALSDDADPDRLAGLGQQRLNQLPAPPPDGRHAAFDQRDRSRRET
jgi:hypothetical protein